MTATLPAAAPARTSPPGPVESAARSTFDLQGADMTQLDLFPVQPTGVKRPKTQREQEASQRIHWSAYKGSAHIQCYPCVAVVAEAPPGPAPKVRGATQKRTVGECTAECRENLRRLGVGCRHISFFCGEHATDQKKADGVKP